jgi:hypothetical protein
MTPDADIDKRIKPASATFNVMMSWLFEDRIAAEHLRRRRSLTSPMTASPPRCRRAKFYVIYELA